jgi:hypothetical protein
VKTYFGSASYDPLPDDVFVFPLAYCCAIWANTLVGRWSISLDIEGVVDEAMLELELELRDGIDDPDVEPGIAVLVFAEAAEDVAAMGAVTLLACGAAIVIGWGGPISPAEGNCDWPKSPP